MRAMILERPGAITSEPLKAVEVPTPQPGPGELLIKVLACGVCRTDLHVVEGDLPNPKLPLIPGHQVVGTVVEGGRRLKPGTRVGVAWLHRTCGECEFCECGKENLCPNSLYTGYHRDGGYAEFIVAPEAYVYEIPAQFGDAEATPLLCAGIIGYRALQRSNLPRRGSLAVFGFGSSAHITVQLAKARGAAIYVASRGTKHRTFAEQYGVAWIGGPSDRPPQPVDSAIVFAPAGEIVPHALRALKKGGTAAIAGIHLSDIPSMSYEEHLFHEKDLRSVEANTREDGRQLLAEAVQIPIRPEVTTFPLGLANEALRKLKQDEINGTAVVIP